MSGAAGEIRYRRLQAPREHGRVLIDPSPRRCQEAISANIAILQDAQAVQIGSTTLGEIRQSAQQDLLQLARRFTEGYGRLLPATSPVGPLIVTGHQPALSHPGVWFKNFLAHRLAEDLSGAAINVIIDTDVAPLPAIACLAGGTENPLRMHVSYDEPSPQLAWELTQVKSKTSLENFPNRLRECWLDIPNRSGIDRFWSRVPQLVDQGQPLGIAFSAARSWEEDAAGLQVLDVPFSLLSRREWFSQFVLAIIDSAERFQSIYNACAREYRMVHRIRGTSHPVPDLARDGDWTELPLWVYSQEFPQRRGVWVRRFGGQLQLSDRHGWHLQLGNQTALAQLSRLNESGICLRTRALATTLVLRLAVADLFIHGIGGAKYDQVTDAIIHRWLGIEPPRFVAATATVHLPVLASDRNSMSTSAAHDLIRDWQFNPERVLTRLGRGTRQSEQSVKDKLELLNDIPTPQKKPAWHRRIVDLNSRIRAEFPGMDSELRQLLEDAVAGEHARRLLQSREWPACIFPFEYLRELLLDLARRDT